jgi:type I restriction enzyme M protein
MLAATHDIVAKLWNLCNVLKDDGVTYHQYVSELTYLLFLKMALETGQEQGIPEEWRWGELEALTGIRQLEHYKLMLLELGGSGSGASPLVQEIYANASSFIKKPTTLNRLVSEIDKLDWYSARQEGLGDLYEGCCRRTPRRRNQEQANTSPRAR